MGAGSRVFSGYLRRKGPLRAQSHGLGAPSGGPRALTRDHQDEFVVKLEEERGVGKPLVTLLKARANAEVLIFN